MLPSYDQLLKQLTASPALAPVIVQPFVPEAIEAVELAFESQPVVYLTGDAARLEPLVARSGLDPTRTEIVHSTTSAEAVDAAVRLVRSGDARYVVKGSIGSADLLRGLLGRGGLGTGRVASHLYVIDSPAFAGRTIGFADAGVNIEPDLDTKADIVRNSAEALRRLGVERPLLAVLSAVELVKAALPSGLDAAMLSAMARRGQLGAVEVDGPLSLDAALSEYAASAKALAGPVAGKADILLAPEINAANMTSKALIGVTGRAMGVVLGLTAPVALPSRGDSRETRAHSLLLASFLAQQATSPP